MEKKYIFYFLIYIFFLTSCNGTKENRVEKEYFDMEVLVFQQIQLLDDLNPYLLKNASINGVEEKKHRKLDSTEWVSELSVFLEADINKPSLIGNYNEEVDQKEKQKTITYKAKDPKEVQVEFLKITYHNDQIKQIESLFTEKNLLYVTRRILQMNFKENNQGDPVLSDFQIRGKQKMIFKDTIQYNIKSEILF